MRRFIVLLGPPGAGKGTQAELLGTHLRLVHISSGDLFRRHMSQGTALGIRIKGFMDRGDLVPDDLTIQMIMERLDEPDCQAGVIFDGFPRTLPQARILECALAGRGEGIERAVLLVINDQLVIDRLSARRFCSQCGRVYNLAMVAQMPQVPDRCDLDGAELKQRDDDKPGTMKNRLKVYYTQTAPLIGFYESLGLLSEVRSDREPQVVFAEIADLLSESKP